MRKLRFLIVVLFLNIVASAEVVSMLNVPDGEITISRFLDYSNYRKNPDGKKFFKTKIAITIKYKNKKKTKELLSGLYTPKNIMWNGMSPAILFDPNKMILTIFMNGKTSRYDYGMEGYAFRYTMKSQKWQKEKVFDNANFGWFSFFQGSKNGQPVLWYFSYAGYYAIKSERSPDGQWTNYLVGKISPEQAKKIYERSKKILITSGLENQTMILQNTSDNVNAAIGIGIAAVAAYGLYKLFAKSLSTSPNNSKKESQQTNNSVSVKNDCYRQTCSVYVNGSYYDPISYKYNSSGVPKGCYYIFFKAEIGTYCPNYVASSMRLSSSCGTTSAYSLHNAMEKTANCVINEHY